MKNAKNFKLCHSEYYRMTKIFDKLYENAQQGKQFKNLMQYMISEENLLLAYRNIKLNTGSYTPSCDGLTIDDIEKFHVKTLYTR
ncbi:MULTISPECIES: hypothetical protein [unclassified Enterococcus]|uniref:hypothetical protein n=1 Tax=unclassified Enterococcus TaxID=2608891 RepID=UPI001906C3EA|nr:MULTISPECIES: hypothetical protein [unclassified Enterococcus]MBK0038838.1 hypothetical protein [Enterococcus sp. S52]MBK0070859.1 hypothetical protein [Enterococcus sp. S53]MBK0142526.1 hypothetical protein [Enterococcus sp. S76]MBK0146221.1 hypothetical protein [Enterococcus sp. S77]